MKLSANDISFLIGKYPWCLCGGMAVHLYCPTRPPTDDVDILVMASVDEAVALLSDFAMRGFEAQLLGFCKPIAWRLTKPDVQTLDLLITGENPFLECAVENAVDVDGWPVICLSDLIVMKRWAMREKDIFDLDLLEKEVEHVEEG